MLGKAFVLGSFLAWYTGHDRAKQAFLLAVILATIWYAVKFTLHRRKWSKYVCPLSWLIQPGPPHSFFWGHLKVFGEATSRHGFESFELALNEFIEYAPGGVL
jgi:hypothetical protein